MPAGSCRGGAAGCHTPAWGAAACQRRRAGSRRQAAEQQQARLRQELTAKLLRGEQLSAAELQPNITAWQDEIEGLVADLVHAVQQLAVAPAPGPAAQQDQELLEDLAAALPPGAQRAAVQAALESARAFAVDALPPQAVLLAANQAQEWAALCTPLLWSDPELETYWELFQRACHQSLRGLVLRQRLDSLRGDLMQVRLRPMPRDVAAALGLATAAPWLPPRGPDSNEE